MANALISRCLIGNSQTMVNTRNIAVVVCIVFAGFIISSAATSPRKLSENRSYDGGWEMDMATLDLLALALQAEPDATGYIFIYGSRRGYRNDVSKRMQCMKNYLIQRRGIPAGRLSVVNGGYRKQVIVEMWLAPGGSLAPVPRPAVPRKQVRFKRGGSKYTCNL